MKKRRIIFIASCALLVSSSAALYRPFWFDELLTFQWLRYPLFEIPLNYPIPNNHIVFSMLLSLWSDLLAAFQTTNVFSVRLLPLAGGLLSVCVLGSGLQRRGKAGMLLLFLFALSCTASVFATAVRGYIFAFLFVTLAFLEGTAYFRKGKKRDFLLFLVSGFLACGVMPSAFFLIETPAILALIAMRDKKKIPRFLFLFLAPCALLILFYFPILDQLYRASRLREGWYSFPSAMANLYLAFLLLVLPVLPFALAGIIRLWKKFKWSIPAGILVFLLPAGLCLIAQVPPFPRIFFPLFGVWILLLSLPLSAFLRKKKMFQNLLLLSLCWIAVTFTFREKISDLLFTSGPHDDLFAPYYTREDFNPEETAKEAVKRLPGDAVIFCDFSADPPSLVPFLSGQGLDMERFLYDRHDRPQVTELGENALLIISGETDLPALMKRFSLSEKEYTVLPGKNFHRICLRNR